MRVYLSGGVAFATDHREAFRRAAAAVEVCGHQPVNPLDVGPWCGREPGPCPDLANGGQENRGHTWRCWMRGDLAVLLDCDAILMSRGWEASHGARLELSVAAATGIAVYTSPVDLPRS